MTKYTDLCEQADRTLQGVTKLAADCELAAKVMAETGTFETGQAILKEAAAALTALAAQVAELTRERDVSNACNRGLVRLNEATQARAEAAEAKVARLEGALRYCEQAPFSGWTIAQAIARAALTEGTPE